MEWKIVLIKVFFTDLSDYKIRPVLIFKKYENLDYMFLPLTSNLSKKWIKISNKNLINWNLDTESVILIPKFWIVSKDLIIKEIAQLDIEILFKIWQNICKEFWCDIMF